MSTEGSVAIDLGALLRESISEGFAPVAAESGHMPVQLAPVPPQSVTARVPTPGEFKVVPMPTVAHSFSPQPVPTLAPESVRGLAMDITPVAVAVSKKSRGGLVGMVLGAVALASMMGGGAAFYMHRHDANAAKLAAAAAPPAVATEAAPVEKAAMPALIRSDEPKAEAKVEEPAQTETTAAAAPAEEPAVEAAKAKTTKHHRTAKIETAAAPVKVEVAAKAVEAPKPVAKAEPKPVVEAPKPIAKAEKPAAAAPPPPPAAKAPATGVDSVLQQQLSGAI